MPGHPGVQGACRYCQWVLLWAESLQIKNYDVVFIDPKNKPAWFLEISPKGTAPVARHKGEVYPDSKSIVAYLKSCAEGAAVTPLDALPERVAALEQSPLTDHLWTLLGNTGDASAEGRRLLVEELGKIDAVLAECGGSDGSDGSFPSVAGGAAACAVDLSLVPKLEHTLVAGRHLAQPPFDPFAGGALARVKRYHERFRCLKQPVGFMQSTVSD